VRNHLVDFLVNRSKGYLRAQPPAAKVVNLR
jgi:hypothetical protein